MNVLFRFFWLFFPSIILLIIGIWVDWCFYAGLAVLLLDIIVSFVEQVNIQSVMVSESDNEDFREFQDAMFSDGNTFANVRNFLDSTIILQMDDSTFESDDIIYNMNNNIFQKCNYGNDMTQLNEFERVFFVTQTLEMEVNNGGFSQFFFNSSGDFSNELVNTFTKIGALKTAETCKKALSIFPDKIPTDRMERQDLLDNMDWDKIDIVLAKCDEEFFKYEDNLEELNIAYITKYREFFEFKNLARYIKYLFTSCSIFPVFKIVCSVS